MGCSLEQYRWAIGKFSPPNSKKRLKLCRGRRSRSRGSGRSRSSPAPLLLAFLLALLATSQSSTAPGASQLHLLLPAPSAISPFSATQSSLYTAPSCPLASPQPINSLVEQEIRRCLLPCQGVEKNPGPSFMCQLCHMYEATDKPNKTRHLKWYCPARDQVPGPVGVRRSSRREEEEQVLMTFKRLSLMVTLQEPAVAPVSTTAAPGRSRKRKQRGDQVSGV